MSILKLSATVRVVASTDPEDTRYIGMTGRLVDIRPENEDGDFFGVRFTPKEYTRETLADNHIIYFWAEELRVQP